MEPIPSAAQPRSVASVGAFASVAHAASVTSVEPTMRLSMICLAAATAGWLALPLSSAAAADCDLAIRHATTVAVYGERAFMSDSYVLAGDAAASARIPSIDAARHAKACGCKEAVAPLEDATLTAARANVVLNLDGAKGYGARIRKDAETALEALRRCAAQ